VQSVGFVVTTVSACMMVMQAEWYAFARDLRCRSGHGRRIRLIRGAFGRIMPADVAARLKDPEHKGFHKYDEASVLFADIAGFTERATPPPQPN
jgi:adenylate cyclase